MPSRFLCEKILGKYRERIHIHFFNENLHSKWLELDFKEKVSDPSAGHSTWAPAIDVNPVLVSEQSEPVAPFCQEIHNNPVKIRIPYHCNAGWLKKCQAPKKG